MKKMTKKQFAKFASIHGCDSRYSGKLQKFFITKLTKIRISDLHMIINSR